MCYLTYHTYYLGLELREIKVTLLDFPMSPATYREIVIPVITGTQILIPFKQFTEGYEKIKRQLMKI